MSFCSRHMSRRPLVDGHGVYPEAKFRLNPSIPWPLPFMPREGYDPRYREPVAGHRGLDTPETEHVRLRRTVI